MPDKDAVLNVLQEKVMDPELMMNIVDLGLIYDVEMASETVADVTMTLTSPGMPGRSADHQVGAGRGPEGLPGTGTR